MRPSSKILLWLIGGLAFLGFLDASFLTVKHYIGGAVPCLLFSGCDTVTTSAYATIGPIPVAFFGALFYLAVLVLVILYSDLKKLIFLRLIFGLSLLTFLASLYFLAVQIFILNSYCFYCLVSAVLSTSIFGLSLGGRFYRAYNGSDESALSQV